MINVPKIFCIDLDGTLCTNTFGDYEKALPLNGAISKVNSLYEQGNTIKIFTARGSGSGKDWRHVTEFQLKNWQVRYHELILGKPEADFYIDDKAILASDFLHQESGVVQIDSSHEYFQESILNAASSLIRGSVQIPLIARAANLVTECLMSGNKVLWCGNGGSAADSQHLAAELVGRFAKNRPPLPSIALTTDTSILTALGNDYGFETVFSRQVQAIGKPNDVLIGISTSGESKNVIEALRTAKKIGLKTIAFTGKGSCTIDHEADLCLKAQTEITGHIQESHICWGQAICGFAESRIFP